MTSNLNCTSNRIVSFETRDGVRLSGYWHASKNQCASPTAILFHGNGVLGSSIWKWGLYYRLQGCNVLLAEYRGYGLSEGEAGGPNQELEAYLDAEAALKYVLSQGVLLCKTVAHGFSLGGAYAASLGRFFSVPYVILDHTFTSFDALGTSKFPFSISSNWFSSAYAQARASRDPTMIGSQDIETDGFNTLQKVRNMQAHIFVISGKQDNMMPLHFGTEFLEARYPSDRERQQACQLVLPSGHKYSYHEVANHPERKKLDLFLQHVHRDA